MKKNYMNLIFVAVVSLLFTTACSKDDDGEKAPVAVSFKTLVADGSVTITTSTLTLTFSQDIEGLTADDLTLTAATTGATKGALTAKGQGVYELAVNGITAAGNVTVAAAKAGYEIAPASKSVNVFYVAPVITNKPLIAAIEAVGKVSFTKNSEGNVDVTANKTLIEGFNLKLDLDGKGLTSLEGIEFFTNLKTLYCSRNKITTLDVSKLLKLEDLYCSGNLLTSLDLSALSKLKDLYCYSNSNLTSLALPVALTYLDVNNCALTTLNLSACTGLSLIYCSGNRLSTLDISMLNKVELSDAGIHCGAQTSDGTTAQAITVTVTQKQSDGKASGWLELSKNKDVTLNIKK